MSAIRLRAISVPGERAAWRRVSVAGRSGSATIAIADRVEALVLAARAVGLAVGLRRERAPQPVGLTAPMSGAIRASPSVDRRDPDSAAVDVSGATDYSSSRHRRCATKWSVTA